MHDEVIDEDSLRYLIKVGDELRRYYVKILCIVNDLYREGIIPFPEDDPEFDIEGNDNEEFCPDEELIELIFTRLEFRNMMEEEGLS